LTLELIPVCIVAQQAAYILKNRPAPAAATNSLDLSIEAAFKAADNNSDGVITKDEFAPAGNKYHFLQVKLCFFYVNLYFILLPRLFSSG